MPVVGLQRRSVGLRRLSFTTTQSASQIDLLEKALKTFALVTDKNERFKAIARVVQSKTKKQCYEKYKELQKQGEGKQEPKAGKDSAARVKVKAPLGVSQTTVADLLAEDISGGRKSSTFSASKASADSWNSLARHVGIEEAQPPRPTQPSAAAARRSLSHRGEIVIDDSDDDENEGAVVEDIRPATAPTRSFPSRSGPPESFASFDRPPEASWSSKQRAPSRESKKAETLSLAEVGIEDEIEEDIAGNFIAAPCRKWLIFCVEGLLEPTLPSGGHALASGRLSSLLPPIAPALQLPSRYRAAYHSTRSPHQPHLSLWVRSEATARFQ